MVRPGMAGSLLSTAALHPDKFWVTQCPTTGSETFSHIISTVHWVPHDIRGVELKAT